MKMIVSVLTGLLLVGCSGLPEETKVVLAEKNEWKQIGMLDGQAGHYQRAKPELAELSMLTTSAYAEYKQGYHIGIEQFCQPDMSYDKGFSGDLYKGQCVNTQHEDITVKQWKAGYEDYLFKTAFAFNTE